MAESTPSRSGPASPEPAVPAAAYAPDPRFTERQGAAAIWTTVRRNALLILFTLAVVMVPVVYSVIKEAPTFRATAMVRLVDARGAISRTIDPSSGPARMGSEVDALLSHVQVLKGRSVMGAVVDREGLRLRLPGELSREHVTGVEVAPMAPSGRVTVRFFDDVFSASYGDEEVRTAYGAPAKVGPVQFTVNARPSVQEAVLRVVSRDSAIDALSSRVKTTVQSKTDAISIQYSDRDPFAAQLVANAVVEVFQAADAAAAQEAAKRRRIFHEAQLEATEASLVQALTELSEFRSRTQSYSSRESITAQQQALLDLDARRAESVADRQMYETLLRRLEQQPRDQESILRTLVSSPGIASNAVVAQLYSRLVEYQAQRAGLTSGVQASTAAHPEVSRLDGLIASTQSSLVAAIQSHVSSLGSRITALEGLRGQSSAEMRQLPRHEVEETRLVQQAQSLQNLADQLREELQKARLAEALAIGQVETVYPAPLPTTPSSKRPLKLLAGLMVGMALGMSAAFARDSVNTSLRRREDVERTLNVPSLSVIPHILPQQRQARLLRSGGDAPQDAQEIAVGFSAVASGAAEAYRMLRNQVLFAGHERDLRTLAVTSAMPGEGKTITAANLAVVMANQGKRVLLIDCDVHRGRLHEVFHIPVGPGIAEVLSGTVDLVASIHDTPVEGLSVISRGSHAATTQEELVSPQMRAVLDRVAERFDAVILDTAPVLAVSETPVLAALADGVVLVVCAGRTSQVAAQTAMKQLTTLKANVIGSVINDPAGLLPNHDHYYTYYKGYSVAGS